MSTRVEQKSMPQFDPEAARKMGAAVGGLTALVAEILSLRDRVAALERAACSALGGRCEWPHTCEERGSCAYGVNPSEKGGA